MISRLLGLALTLAAVTLAAASAGAITIYPIDRAQILAGSRFDLKIEFDGVVAASDAKITIDGTDLSAAVGRPAAFVEREDGVAASALILRDVSLTKPGRYAVVASDGKVSRTVSWEVYATGPRKARNVILFIGDGMSAAHRTAARILSAGISEGKDHGGLAMDTMPNMALVGTAGVDSIITDSANSMSAYTTGHKSSVNALGVYADRTPDTLDDPRVETLTSLIKRTGKIAVGVVTNTEVEDATPAAMVAHTRRRSDYDQIVGMFHESGVDVLMGGGAAHFLPKSSPGSRRKDDIDYLAKFRTGGYAIATTEREMKSATADPATRKLLGLFHPSNMDGVLDRKFLKQGTVPSFPEQPDLVDMVRTALTVLARHDDGFVLMVESGLIDKYSHPLDWERAVMDTIMLDRAVAAAKEFAAARNDTLILVTADHTPWTTRPGGRRCATRSASTRRPDSPTIRPPTTRATRRGSTSRGGWRSSFRPSPTTTRPTAPSSTGRSSPRSWRPTSPTSPTTSTRTRPARSCASATSRTAPRRACTRARTWY